jgi:hypothetical protein
MIKSAQVVIRDTRFSLISLSVLFLTHRHKIIAKIMAKIQPVPRTYASLFGSPKTPYK